MIIALDLGTRTGWAMTHNNSLISGFVDFKNSRYEGGGMRYLRFRKWLESTAKEAEVLYFEEVRRHRGTDAAHVYGGLLATLTSFCEEHEIPYQGVPVGTIKKHATGNGAAGKDKMLMAACRIADRQIDDDNEADAICLLDCMKDDIFA